MAKSKRKEYEVQYLYFREYKTIKTYHDEDKAWDFIHSCAKQCGNWVYDILAVTTTAD